jgi:hypothetical protein
VPDVAQLLQTLHPLREPPPPTPVLPYLAMLTVGVAAAASLLGIMRFAGRRQRELRLRAEAALAAARRLPPADRLAAQAHLLRALVRSLHGDEEAKLGGGVWLQRLDHTFRTTFFSQGDGRAYGDDLYRRQGTVSAEKLDGALHRLIRRGRFAGPARATGRRA